MANVILAHFSWKLSLVSKFAGHGEEMMCVTGGLVP